jgi:predicted RNase H-like nuclease
MSVIDRLEELKERATELEEVREKLWDLLCLIEEVENMMPENILGSHHAEMEYGDTLAEVEQELQEIEDKVDN